MNEFQEALHRRLHNDADLEYLLHLFGDELAKRHGYKSVEGIAAVQFHLCVTHHWTPSQVRSMTPEDLRFLVTEDMHTWTAPAASVPGREGKLPPEH